MTEPEAVDQEGEGPTVPFFPVQFMREFWMAVAITALFFAMTWFKPIFGLEMGPPADPMVTPQHIKPEWYFLAIYQVLKYVPKTPGALIPVAVIGLLVVLPFVNRKPDTDSRALRYRSAVVAVLAVVFLVSTVLGRK